MKTLLGLAAATAALITTAPAAAAPDETRQVRVQYDDLNLASAKGQKILERRLAAAAREVCGLNEQKTGSRIRTEKEMQCHRQARTTAMQRYALLTERYQLGG